MYGITGGSKLVLVLCAQEFGCWLSLQGIFASSAWAYVSNESRRHTQSVTVCKSTRHQTLSLDWAGSTKYCCSWYKHGTGRPAVTLSVSGIVHT